MSPPLKALHIMSACTVGGAEMHVLSLLGGLIATGEYEVHLAYFKERPDNARSLKKDFENLGVQVHDLQAGVKFDPRAIARLAGLLRHHEFDIVHSHSYLASVMLAVVTTLVRRPDVMISSMHNEERIFLNPVFSRLWRVASRRQNGLIVISNAVREYMISKARVDPDAITRIYYGLEEAGDAGDESSLRKEFDLPADSTLIALPGRLAEQKGHKYLIEAMPTVLKSIPNTKLLVMGHEDSLSQADLMEFVQANGVQDSVIFCGFRSDIIGDLRQTDLMVLPSLWEGFGLVLLEAMAAECPIVATNVGPIPEVVIDGTTGVLVPPANSAALADAVVKVLGDPLLAGSLTAAGTERLKTYFTMDAMIGQTTDLYQELLHRAHDSAGTDS